MDYLEQADKRRTKKIKKANPQKGFFVNLILCFGDVWYEIDEVFDDSCTVFKHRRGQSPTELVLFCDIRTVKKELPKDARVICCKEGRLGTRDATLKSLPKRFN